MIVCGFDSAEMSRVTLENHSGFNMRHVFISPGDSEEWGADILSSAGGDEFLYAGGKLHVYVHFQHTHPSFDIWTIDEDFDSYVIRDVQARGNLYIAVGREHHEPATGKPAFTELILTNASDKDIWFLFFSPDNSEVWGADILTHEGVFEAGNSIRVVLPSEDGQYDLLGLTETGDNYYRSLSMPEPGTSTFIDITEADRR